jgi:hypothetical protein
MPTTIYTDQKITSVGYDGKEYPVKDGAVDVPDNAVAVLTESFGFFTTAPETVAAKPADDNKTFDIKTATKAELVKLNKDLELGASVANTMTLEKVQELVIPLYEAKQAASAAAAQ